MRDPLYDVAIVGAGPAGSAAAFVLAQAGLRVGLIDKADFPRDKTCGDTLTPGALRTLDMLGILDTVVKHGFRINTVSLNAPSGQPLISNFPNQRGWPTYALGIPRLILDNILRDDAGAAGADLLSGINVTTIGPERTAVTLHGEQHGKPITCLARLVIVATGANVGVHLRNGLLKRTPRFMLAVRTYYESADPLPSIMQMHFDGIPLPGYGWLFPVSETVLNVGIGLCPVGLAAYWLHSKPQPSFASFIAGPNIAAKLASMKACSPRSGYPIRVDFATAPTFGERMLIVGEAAGLVNPLTGEGIDYALASGYLAAQHIIHMFKSGNLSVQALAGYDRLLRKRFQRLFILSNLIRDGLVNRPALNWLVRQGADHESLRLLLMRVLLGYSGDPVFPGYGKRSAGGL